MNMRDTIIDHGIRELVQLAKAGDKLAAERLHSALAQALLNDTATDYQKALLAEMHLAIAHGQDAAAAMFTTPPPNRSVERRRHFEIYRQVRGWLIFREHTGEGPSNGQIHDAVGRMYGVKGKTVANIYARLRKLESEAP